MNASTGTETAPSSTRGVQLTPDQLEALKPHVIALDDGRLGREATPHPQTAKRFTTVEADIDAIFRTHLPAFIEEKGLGTVPIVLYAHGGLVGVEAGFATAHQQVQWWKDNGVYPIHFVWKSGAMTAIWDAIGRWVTGGSRGPLGDAKDFLIEKGARAIGGEPVWRDMKLDAAASSDKAGGARVFVTKLREWMKDNPDRASIHALGHSAGSIFHAHLVPVALEAGIPRFETVTFLAPAVRMDTFRTLLLPHTDKIGKLTIFTMTEKAELDDNCFTHYGKSLLCLVSAAFEPNPGTRILGLHKDIQADGAVRHLLEGPAGELVLTPNKNSGDRASGADSHGGFDNDPRTMESVLLRVTGLKKPKAPFPSGARSTDPLGDVVVPESPRGTTGKTALCVGIDDYKQPSDRLKGAVEDTQSWGEVLRGAGFTVTTLTNSDATRANILGALFRMVTTAAPDDVLVFQYAGHGTFVTDERGGDEKDGKDEAICPVDFREGQLILDDDLARIWDLLPDRVSLTIFFDSCHSGNGSRRVSESEVSLPRGVELTSEDEYEFRAARGMAAPKGKDEALERVKDSETDTTPEPAGETSRQREVLFAACESHELAWETNGQGDFTRTVAPLLAEHIGKVSNRAFFEKIAATFDAHRQTPSFTALDEHSEALLLSRGGKADERTDDGGVSEAGPDGPAAVLSGLAAPSGSRKDAAVAQILRGLADLIES